MDALAGPPVANAEQVEYWNGPEGQHWVEHEARFDAMLAPFVDPILDAAGVAAGDRVLDVGCGNGALSRAAAARGASVTGVDISAPMIERARSRAEAAGVDVEFVVADAQIHDFGDTFDAVISRFGVMFFDDPHAAFASLATALRPGGRLAFSCWQDLPANEWAMVPAAAIVPIVGPPEPPPPDAPGPFAFADAARVEATLTAADLSAVTVEPFTSSLLLGGGGNVDDTVAWFATSGMAKRFLADADEAAVERAMAAVRDALAPYESDDGVRLTSAAWIVRATR